MPDTPLRAAPGSDHRGDDAPPSRLAQTPSATAPPLAAGASSSTFHNGILVCVRPRPQNPKEATDPNCKLVATALQNDLILDVSNRRNAKRNIVPTAVDTKPSAVQRYPFHHVFHRTSQVDVFLASCAPIVLGAFEGINGAVMAYGATGSGKTYTMFGEGISAPGTIFHAAQLMFAERQRRLLESPEMRIDLTLTFVEIYQEEVYDLLSDGPREKGGKPLSVQDVGETGKQSRANAEAFVLRGVTSASLIDLRHFNDLVELGLSHRVVAATSKNARSSRSHAIVTVEVVCRRDVKTSSTSSADSSFGTIARIRFCDLAGSERAAQLASDKDRLQEGAKINHGLMELGRVMQSLAVRSRWTNADKSSKAAKPGGGPFSSASQQQQGRSGSAASLNICWRGSKLTRLMRDSLEVNCRTSLIVCVSPTSYALEDTINAMQFAMNAKEVQLTATANEYVVTSTDLVKQQKETIERLEDRLEAVTSLCSEALRQHLSEADYQALMARIGSLQSLPDDNHAHSGSAAPTRLLSSPLPAGPTSVAVGGGCATAARSPPQALITLTSAQDSTSSKVVTEANQPPLLPHPGKHLEVPVASSPAAGLSNPASALSTAVMHGSANNSVIDMQKYEALRTGVGHLTDAKAELLNQLKELKSAMADVDVHIRRTVLIMYQALLDSQTNRTPDRSYLDQLLSRRRELANRVARIEQEHSELGAKCHTLCKELRSRTTDFVDELVLDRARQKDAASSHEVLATDFNIDLNAMGQRKDEHDQWETIKLGIIDRILTRYRIPHDCELRMKLERINALHAMMDYETDPMVDAYTRKEEEWRSQMAEAAAAAGGSSEDGSEWIPGGQEELLKSADDQSSDAASCTPPTTPVPMLTSSSAPAQRTTISARVTVRSTKEGDVSYLRAANDPHPSDVVKGRRTVDLSFRYDPTSSTINPTGVVRRPLEPTPQMQSLAAAATKYKVNRTPPLSTAFQRSATSSLNFSASPAALNNILSQRKFGIVSSARDGLVQAPQRKPPLPTIAVRR